VWKLERESKRVELTRFQFFLKKAGPKPSGPGLELSFIVKRAVRISSREKGRARAEACEGVREVEVTSEARSS
jgi:hypothetical protein